MEIDTGSPISLVSLDNFPRIAPDIKTLEKVRTTFVSYTKNMLKILGKSSITVQCNDQIVQADLYVVDGDVSTLLGRKWMSKLKLN